MGFSEDRKASIFQKTDGCCYHCGKKLVWKNYGLPDTNGCWEIDHSLPKSKGGTDHLNNMVPSCIPCNRDKGNLTTRQYRKQFEPQSENIGLGVIGGIIILFGLYSYLKRIANRTKT